MRYECITLYVYIFAISCRVWKKAQQQDEYTYSINKTEASKEASKQFMSKDLS